MSSNALWAIAVITVSIFAGIVVTLMMGAKEMVPALVGIGGSLTAAVAAISSARANKNDKDAPH